MDTGRTPTDRTVHTVATTEATTEAAARELRRIARAGLRHDRLDRQRDLLTASPVLRELPAVQAAGYDPIVRFEYLSQAIVDAIEELTPPLELSEQGNDFDTRLHNGELAATALRALFGLTPQTRHRTWRVRQEEAAMLFHVSWDRFRHDRQSDLLSQLARTMLTPAGRQFGALWPEIERGGSGVTVYPAQRFVEDDLIDYIHRVRPEQAFLLELSTSTILPILCALRDSGTLIRILVGDPSNAAANWQRRRIAATLRELATGEFRDYPNVRVKFYSTPPSVRGRLIGDLVAAGWYTYRDDARRDSTDPELPEVWGHDNALIAARVDSGPGSVLAEWFRREFHRMWTHRRTRYDNELFPRPAQGCSEPA